MHRRFEPVVEDPGETHAFRTRFHQAVWLCLLYRLLGTVAATIGFAGHSGVLTDNPDNPMVIYALVATYFGYSAVILYRIGWPEISLPERRLRLRLTKDCDWLDRPLIVYGDVAVALVLNLILAVLVRRGEVYSPYADVFTLALITSVVVLTGRRGGKEGLYGVGLAAAVEVAQGPLNRLGLDDLNWAVIVFRVFWVLCGWVVAVGIVRILLDYAERTERLRLEDEMLTRLSRSHNEYKEALRGIASLLASNDDGKSDLAVQLAQAALACEERPDHPSADTLEDVVATVIKRARVTAEPTFEFVAVDNAHSPVRLAEPEALARVLFNLCSNAARHSQGTRATIRWSCVGEELVITVRDDGVGLGSNGPGEGLVMSRRVLEPLGGELVSEAVTQGTKWVLRLPAGAYEA